MEMHKMNVGKDLEKETSMRSEVAQDAGSAPVSFDEALQSWEQEMEQVFEANRAAEQLSAEDFAIRINTKA